MIISGKEIAERIYSELIQAGTETKALTLGIVVVGDDPVIASFVRIKSHAAERLGVNIVPIHLPATATTEEACEAVRNLIGRCNGIIVQLPLPPQIDNERVLSTLPAELDIDAINPDIPDVDRVVRAPVAGAIRELLQQSGIDPVGKRTVVVGAGNLVGMPAAHLLKELGAVVSTVTLESGSLTELRDADIIVLGAGNPGLVKPEMIKQGVVLIDAGTSESAGKVVGDADPACAPLCALFTPVPGGVGPISVAMIFKNLFELARARAN